MASIEGNLNSKELLEAQSHVWHDMFGFMRSFSLKCAIELGIADAVHNHGKPIALTDLAATLSIPPCRIPHFQRLMGLLVHNGYFKQTNKDIYSLTPNSRVLVRDKEASLTPMIEIHLHQPMLDPWQWLPAWFRKEQPSTAFEMAHSLPMWKAMATMPELRKMVMEGLDSDSAAIAKVIVEDCADQFQGVKSLVEVAGNTGKIALAIAKAFPYIKCSLLELPHVINALEKSDVIEYVAGDMFEHIPPADVLILKVK